MKHSTMRAAAVVFVLAVSLVSLASDAGAWGGGAWRTSEAPGVDASGNVYPSTLTYSNANGYLTLAQSGFGVVSAMGHGPFAGTFVGEWFGPITPSSTNYSFLGDGSTSTIFNVTAGGSIYFRVSNSTFAQGSASNFVFGVPVGGNGTAFVWATATVPLTSGAANTLTAAQYAAPHVRFTGTLSGSGTSVVFPVIDGACWVLDFAAVTFASNTIVLAANGHNWSTSIAGTAASSAAHVCYSAGAAKLIGVALTE